MFTKCKYYCEFVIHFCKLIHAGRIYRDKCGTSELGKAGECFSLAGKYELAAEVYASGNFFRECLSACNKGKHADLGLKYIESWKQQAQSNSEIMARSMEVDRIFQEFLENFALECYKAKNNASMMNFVRSFRSSDSKREFLKSLDCLEELLVLEEALGNFNEASKIAKSLGDTLREVDLLEKAGQFGNAGLLLLSYVFSNSLWGSGNQGWPLKSFPRKVELLNRAMSIAQNVSETFHASICNQAKILLYDQKNWSELMQLYNASKQCNAPIVEILVFRKLLDAHIETNAAKYEWDHELHLDPGSFDQRIAMSQVSVGGLVYLWNFWKTHSVERLECLDSLERTNCMKREGIFGFCLNYFGLRLPDESSVTFHLLNPDAAWVRSIEGLTQKNRNVATLEAHRVASAARQFWIQESVCVGLKVLDAFRQLQKSNTVKNLPKYFQSMCLLHISDVANFFLDSKSFKLNFTEKRKVQESLLVSSQYLELVFSLDPRDSLSEKMISLRETELSKNLLEEIVSSNSSGMRELTYGQIGRTVMTILGTGNLKQPLYDQIAQRLSNNTAWKPFVEILKEIMDSDSSKKVKYSESIGDSAVSDTSHSQCEQGFPLVDLSVAFHRALEETYNIQWRPRDYISPHCFLYLVERLLILAPHPQGFFFTTKSSFLEYLICLPSDANPRTSLVTDNKAHPGGMVDFVVQVVEECLYRRIETVKWIEDSGINCNLYMPVLVLRLLMILCVLSINWNLPRGIVFRWLSRNNIKSELPRAFCDALQSRSSRLGYGDSFASAVASACKSIGDPLVIVVSDGNPNFRYSDAVFLELSSFSCKTDIMETLFPSSPETSHDPPTAVERNVTKPSSKVIPPDVSNEGTNAAVQSSEMASNSSSENGKGNLQINWDLIGEVSEAFESLRNRYDEKLSSLLVRKKVM